MHVFWKTFGFTIVPQTTITCLPMFVPPTVFMSPNTISWFVLVLSYLSLGSDTTGWAQMRMGAQPVCLTTVTPRSLDTSKGGGWVNEIRPNDFVICGPANAGPHRIINLSDTSHDRDHGRNIRARLQVCAAASMGSTCKQTKNCVCPQIR